MRERLQQIKQDLKENLFTKWPAKAIAILVVLGFSFGLAREYLEAALVS